MFDWSLLDVQYQRAAVPVPEFASAFVGEADKTPEIVVRQLTAEERREVLRSSKTIGDYLYYDQALLAYYGSVTGDVDEPGVGRRMFKSPDFLRNLPDDYEPAILRLARRTMELSGMAPAVSTETEEEAEGTGLEQEKKG